MHPTGSVATTICTPGATAPSGSPVCAFGMESTGNSTPSLEEFISEIWVQTPASGEQSGVGGSDLNWLTTSRPSRDEHFARLAEVAGRRRDDRPRANHDFFSAVDGFANVLFAHKFHRRRRR